MIMTRHFKNRIFLLPCVLLSVLSNSWAGENIPHPYKDSQVLKLLGRDYQKVDTLAGAKLKNAIEVKLKLSAKDFFENKKLTYSKFRVLQEFAFMRWEVKRVRASASYDLIIKLGWIDTATREATIVVNVFVVVHREEPYDVGHFNNPKKWNLIKLSKL